MVSELACNGGRRAFDSICWSFVMTFGQIMDPSHPNKYVVTFLEEIKSGLGKSQEYTEDEKAGNPYDTEDYKQEQWLMSRTVVPQQNLTAV